MHEKELRSLAAQPLGALMARANAVRRAASGDVVELCSIVNARSGRCTQDCRFCAQSGRYAKRTRIAAYPLMKKERIVEAACRAADNGAGRFGIVTSGARLSTKDLKAVAAAVTAVRRRAGIRVCASLGSLGEEELVMLRDAGLGRYHHNIETSPRYFPKVVTTHTYRSRLDTIAAAKRAGLEVCSGGIIGMGETREDRLQMALELRRLDVDSVPLNILVPIPGTPFASREPLPCDEVIRTIALFRIVLGARTIKVAAGRETALKDFQVLAFMAGANGMLIGGYLTVKGRSVEEDRRFVEEVRNLWRT